MVAFCQSVLLKRGGMERACSSIGLLIIFYFKLDWPAEAEEERKQYYDTNGHSERHTNTSHYQNSCTRHHRYTVVLENRNKMAKIRFITRQNPENRQWLLCFRCL